MNPPRPGQLPPEGGPVQPTNRLTEAVSTARPRLRAELPSYGVSIDVVLYIDRAPSVCHSIWESLREPLVTTTAHACFAGHQVFCFLRPFGTKPPPENQTLRPKVGEVMFFHAAEKEFAYTADERLGGGSEVCELAFMYGEVDLRHWSEEGVRGCLVGRLEGDVNGFAEACRATLDRGSTDLVLSRASAG